VADFLEGDRRFVADDLEAALVDVPFLLALFLVAFFFLAAAFFPFADFLLLELDPSPTNSAMRATIPFFFLLLVFVGRPCFLTFSASIRCPNASISSSLYASPALSMS
jgi:hypothetical protein